jgi:hypothetical protein
MLVWESLFSVATKRSGRVGRGVVTIDVIGGSMFLSDWERETGEVRGISNG